jgi:4-amino-4-deoxy-L-arabinose transferase-like glycosyltransferase
MKKRLLILFFIVILAGILRFWNLGQNPPALTWDEVAWGYNAYALGIDGRDEFGRLLPYDYLESFGDFKPPMYAYLDIIPIKLFGLTEFAIRFPSAFFGVLTVLFTYFLTRRIFNNSKSKEQYALFSALFLAISPWHIMLSRAAFEANVANFLIVLGVWGILAAVQDKKMYLIISAISFALSLYTFNTARIVSPILIILLVIAFWKKLFKIKKIVFFSALIGTIIFLPILGFLLSSKASLRFQEVNIFSNPDLIKTSNQEIVNDNNALWSKIIHNRRIIYGLNYLQHFFDNLNPNFIFIRGDENPKFSTQSVGQMYLWDIPFFIIGSLFLFRKKEGKWWLIPLWLLIGIIPAATARETPHALRIESSLPTFQMLVAYGFVLTIEYVNKYRKMITCCLLFLLFFNFYYFYRDYFANYKYSYSDVWQYGYKQSIDYVKSVEKNYDLVKVVNNLGRPYIYYLFYNKVDPKYFRETANITKDGFGFVSVDSFGKYVFSKNYNTNSTGKILYVDTFGNIPRNSKILKRFYLPNGKEIMDAYELIYINYE